MKTNRQFGIQIITFIFLCSSSVFAQTTNEQAISYSERADAAYAEGDLDLAIALYEQAFRFVEDPNFAYNLGAMYSESGNIGQSYNYFSRYVEMYPGASDRADIEAYLQEIETEVHTTCSLVVATSEPIGAEIFLVGEENEHYLGRTPLELWIEPDAFVFEYRLEGYETFQETTTGHPGIRLSSSAQLEEIASEIENLSEETSEENTVSQNEEFSSGNSSLRTTGFVVTGVGVAVLGGGAFFMLQFLGAKSDLEAMSDGSMEATQSSWDDATDTAESAGLLAPVLFVTGGLLTASGIGLIVISGKNEQSEATATIAPITPESWGLTFSGRF